MDMIQRLRAFPWRNPAPPPGVDEPPAVLERRAEAPPAPPAPPRDAARGCIYALRTLISTASPLVAVGAQ